MIFRLNKNVKMIKVRYLVIDASSSYNIIIGRYAFNLLGVAICTLYLCMKYFLSKGRFRFIQGYHDIVRRCYHHCLRVRKKTMAVTKALSSSARGVNFMDLIPIMDPNKER